MSKEKARINVQKQEAKRDIINVAGDYIIQHPITHEPVYIPSIQSVLRKDEIKKGDFFKKEPEWVDYEQGFIVERKEVDEIIKKLVNNKVQLVLGAPASGKSIILKNVGYKLTNQNKVYVVELKKHPQDEIKLFFENIPKIDDESPILIIDDAHLSISYCERLAKEFKSRGKGKLIIGSRETKEIIEGDPTESSELEHLSKTAIHIQAEDVTEEMIKTFLKRQYNLDEERIIEASGNLKNYKKDLWYLSWALKVFDLDNYSVDENKIYKNIKKRIENINAEDVFLPLSVFYRYEISIERKFLEKQMDIEKRIIDGLIELQEIVETEELRKPAMLSLNHSSIADLYFNAYQNYPSFGEKIKERILNQRDEADLEYCSFYRYLTIADSRNAVDIMLYLHRNRGLEKGGKRLIRKLVENDKIQESIKEGIKKEDDIDKIHWCMVYISSASTKARFKLNIDLATLSAKINKEENIDKIREGVVAANKDKEAGLELAHHINIATLSAKINKEEDIGKIGYCVSEIAGVNEIIGLKLANNIDIDALSAKINKEEDIWNIGCCVADILKASKDVGLKLIYTLSAKIKGENDIENIGRCIYRIAEASKEGGLKLANSIDIATLSAKIIKEDEIRKIGSCMKGILKSSEDIGLKLFDALIDTLSLKINEEENIEDIGFQVEEIARVNKDIGLKLANNIDIAVLSSKINKEEKIQRIGSCIRCILYAGEDIGLRLANNIDIDALLLKINKEEDIEEIGRCASGIANASGDRGLRLIDTLSLKINKEENIDKIGACLAYIATANEIVGLKLFNSIDFDVLSSKMEKEENLAKVLQCILGITVTNKEAGLRLIDAISSKIEKEEDVENIWCVPIIAKASNDVGQEIINRLNPKLREELQLQWQNEPFLRQLT